MLTLNSFQSVQAAVSEQLALVQRSQPRKRVALITFNDDVSLNLYVHMKL